MYGDPLRRMMPEVTPDGQVHYGLHVGIDRFPVSALIGARVALRATGALSCTVCGRRVRKFYGSGTCWPCLQQAPEASPCIIRPELCEAHVGGGRDPQWEQEHHFQEHVVYLSQTGASGVGRGGIKVGVTRASRMAMRWVDQGAVLAVPIARTPYRQLAGAIEVDLKRVFPDKTDRAAMLRTVVPDEGALRTAQALAFEAIDPALRPYLLPDAVPSAFHYPGRLPPRVAGVSLLKVPELAGTLVAIKGQYLVWGDGRALNIMTHSGFHVLLDILTTPG